MFFFLWSGPPHFFNPSGAPAYPYTIASMTHLIIIIHAVNYLSIHYRRNIFNEFIIVSASIRDFNSNFAAY